MNKLKYLRKENNYTQKDIAKYLMITQPNYSNYENNKIKLNYDYAKKLSKLYNVPLSYLIDDEESIYITKEELNILINIKNIITKLEKRNK